MADKVANVDIEDVLSSIRRLVSDESDARRVSAPPEARNKLLLTPALRVIPVGPDKDPPDDDEAPEVRKSDTDSKALSALEATIAELEAAVERHPEFEPDGGEDSSVLDAPPALLREAATRGADADAGRRARRLTLGLPDEVQAETPPGTLRLVPEPAAHERDDTGDEDDIVLDEDTLRRMVRQIVQEELQGALGTQITRNLRKLIRREIHDYFDVGENE